MVILKYISIYKYITKSYFPKPLFVTAQGRRIERMILSEINTKTSGKKYPNTTMEPRTAKEGGNG